jgi:hypothetical protein
MYDSIIHIFKYFTRFVPKAALVSVFIQPDRSRMPGYAEIEAEVMSQPDTHVIPPIERYIVSVNENFVAERIRNVKGFILFVEYGKIIVSRDVADGVRQSLSVTVGRPFTDTNGDNLNEVILMNEALAMLDCILHAMNEEQEGLEFCGGKLLQWPVEIRPVDPIEWYGCAGWRALFTNTFTLL